MAAGNVEEFVGVSVPEEERLDNLGLLGRGYRRFMDHLLSRLASYHDLLDLELEDRPAGAVYLEEARASLGKARELLGLYGELLDPVAADDLESFDLEVFLKGLVNRLKKIGRGAVSLNLDAVADEETYLSGRLVLLQQAFFAMTQRLTEAHEGQNLVLTLERRNLERGFIRQHKSELQAGAYYLIFLECQDGHVRFDDMIAGRDRIAGAGALTLDPALLFVQGVMSVHGGDLFVPKETGELASLCLALPVRPAGDDMFGEKTLDGDDLRGTETILLVDDEAIIWDVVIDMLQGLGYTVILAANGRDCVEIYHENPGEIDLVLLDMVMPEMNGHEAFFALRDIDPEAKVLLQSGYVAEENAKDVLDAGAVGFLRKPYRMADLARKIRQVFDR